jgi:hypothetical protein
MSNTETTTDAKTQKIMDRVRDLLAVAEHPNTGVEEADTALKMANSLITKHAIDEAILRMSQTEEERRHPVKTEIKLTGNSWTSAALATILYTIAQTNRCSVVVSWSKATIYGAAEDAAWVEMLYMSAAYELVAKIDPKWDASLSYDHNVYNLKIAGKKWKEIDAIAVWNGHESRETLKAYDAPYSDKVYKTGFFHKLLAAYKRHAKMVGDTSLVSTQSFDVYKLSFIEGFQNRMVNRLMEQAGINDDAIKSSGAELAIVSMAEDARQMMYADFPERDPKNQMIRRQQAIQERADMLAAMTEKQRAEFLEKEEKKNRAAWKRQESNMRPIDGSAQKRGAKAANAVDLNRKAGSAGAGATRKSIG